jgi:hypothetical protein
MSKRLLLVLAPVALFAFVYLHFEYFPSRVGPSLGTAQTELDEWAEKMSAGSTYDAQVKKVRVSDATGVAVADVDFRYLYYEAQGVSQRYTGRGEVAFVRVGKIFRPAWSISKVTLVDNQQTIVMN